MIEKLDTLWIAVIGLVIAFISIAGKVFSTDLYQDKSLKVKLFIIFSKALLGFILCLIIIKGIPKFYPDFVEMSAPIAWLTAYLTFEIAPILVGRVKKEIGGKDDKPN